MQETTHQTKQRKTALSRSAAKRDAPKPIETRRQRGKTDTESKALQEAAHDVSKDMADIGHFWVQNAPFDLNQTKWDIARFNKRDLVSIALITGLSVLAVYSFVVIACFLVGV